MSIEKAGKVSKEQYRVVINREANEALERFVTSLASENESSKFTKSDIANYVFCRLEKFIGSTETAEIKSIFFDAKKALGVILKEATNAEELPEELRQALLKHCGIKSASKEKRQSKLSTPKLVENVG